MADYTWVEGGTRYRVRNVPPVKSPEEFKGLVEQKSAEGQIEVIADEGPSADEMARLIMAIGLPTVGGAIGAALGGPIGAGVGAAGGEYASQQIGASPESGLAIGVAGALPMVPAAVRGVGKMFPGIAPGLQQNFQRLIGEEGGRLIGKVFGKVGEAGQKFQEAEALGQSVLIDASQTRATMQTIVTEQSKLVKSLQAGGLLKTVDDFKILVGSPATGGATLVPLNTFRANQSALGKKLRDLMAKGEGAEAGEAKQLYKAMVTDIEMTAANAPGKLGETLREAVRLYKQDEAADMLKEAFKISTGVKLGMKETSKDAVLTKVMVRDKDIYQRLMGEEGVDDLIRTLQALPDVPTISRGLLTGQTVPFTARQVVGGLAGGALAGLAPGIDPIFSSTTGALGGVLVTDLVSKALSTTSGRFIVRNLARHGATVEQIANAMLQGGRAYLQAGTGAPGPVQLSTPLE